MTLNGLDDQLMATAAHRYCLPRQTYMADACQGWARETWEQFDRKTQYVMVRDTIAALMDGEAGSPTIDEPGWRRFAEWAFQQLSEQDRHLMLHSLEYKEKPWPLQTRP